MAIPGLRGSDHFGFTVPDLDEAEAFLVGVLGAVPVYTLASKQADDDWMTVHLGVHPSTVVRQIRFYRLGNGTNLEVFEYHAADGQKPQPRNSDIGGHHLALYVDDIDEAAAYLRAREVDVMGDPVIECGRFGGPALALFPRALGNAVRAGQLPRGQGLRDRRRCAAVAPGAAGRVNG